MAVTKGKVEVIISIKGDNKASATIKATGDDLRKLEKTAGSAGARIAKAMNGAGQSFLGFKTKVGGALAKLGLVGAGVSAVVRAAKGLGEFVADGAKLSDQMQILQKDVKGLGDIMDRARKASKGMIAEKDLVKAAATFKSFGLPVEQLDRALAEVAKTSIRTGESVTHLTDSLTTGLARQSPMILDNLGLTVKLSEANVRAAEDTGKLTSALSSQEKRMGLTTVVLEKLEKANINVDLTKSRTAQVNKLTNSFGNLWDKLKVGASGVLLDVASELGIVDEQLTSWEQSLKDATGETGRAAGPLETLGNALIWASPLGAAAKGLKALGDELWDLRTPAEKASEAIVATTRFVMSSGQQADRAADSYVAFSAALGRLAKEGELARIDRARQAAEEKVISSHMEKQKRALKIMKADIFEMTKLLPDVATHLYDEEKQKAFATVMNESVELAERLKEASTASSEVVAKEIEQEEIARDLKAEQLAKLGEELAVQDELLAKVNGATSLEMEKAEVKRKIRSLNRDSVVDLRKIIELKKKELQLTEQIAIEASVTSDPEKKGGGGGGGRRKKESVELDDIVKSLRLRAKLESEVSDTKRREIAMRERDVELEAIQLDRNKKRIDQELWMKRISDAKLQFAIKIKAIDDDRLKRELKIFALAGKALELQKKAAEQRKAAQAAAREGLGLGFGSEFDERRKAISDAEGIDAISPEQAGSLQAGTDIREEAAAAAEAYDALGAAALMAAESQNSAIAAFGEFGAAIADNGDLITDMLNQIASAVEGGADATLGAVQSSIKVAGALASAFIKDEQAKAIVMGLVETAASAASFAGSDYTAGAMHAIAAGLYFAAAGDSGSSKKASASAGGGSSRRPTVANQPGGQPIGTTVININAPVIGGGGVQEVATQLGGIGRANRGTGFDAEAA